MKISDIEPEYDDPEARKSFVPRCSRGKKFQIRRNPHRAFLGLHVHWTHGRTMPPWVENHVRPEITPPSQVCDCLSDLEFAAVLAPFGRSLGTTRLRHDLESPAFRSPLHNIRARWDRPLPLSASRTVRPFHMRLDVWIASGLSNCGLPLVPSYLHPDIHLCRTPGRGSSRPAHPDEARGFRITPSVASLILYSLRPRQRL